MAVGFADRHYPKPDFNNTVTCEFFKKLTRFKSFVVTASAVGFYLIRDTQRLKSPLRGDQIFRHQPVISI
jgi:hypothetical protein